MSRGTRIGLALVAAVILAVGIALARPGGNESDRESAPTAQTNLQSAPPEPPASGPSEPAPASSGQNLESDLEAATEPSSPVGEEKPPTAPSAVRLRVRGGEPVGGLSEITVKKGDVVRFVVSADVRDEVHLHGYDISRDVAPGKPASFRFDADIEGVFEIELEERELPVAKLKVEPR